MGRKQQIIEELQDKLADAAWTIEVLEAANANLSEKLAHETHTHVAAEEALERRIDELTTMLEQDSFTMEQRARFELYALVDHLVEEDELAPGHHLHSVHADLLETV